MVNRDFYKLSKFNIAAKDRYGNLLLTNALSNILIKVIDDKISTQSIYDLNEDLVSHLSNDNLTKFVKYGILVENHVDKRKIVDQVYCDNVEKNKRLDIVILTTNQCNFSCVYCFQKREVSQPHRHTML